MITYFTTAKNFIGNTGVAQINAIRSWQQSLPGSRIIIFGTAEGLDGLANEPGIIVDPSVRVSLEGTPCIDDMFLKAQHLTENPICCFINADIIVTRAFADSLRKIHDVIRGGYLIVGQRIDVGIGHELSFHEHWETKLHDYVKIHGHLHPPEGSDFFAFPNGQYKLGEIPGLLVGRGGWDLWMIYHGRKRGMKVIDISPTITVIHQNHDYSHRRNCYLSYNHDAEAQHNIRFIPAGETYPYNILACNYVYKKGRIHRNFARGHPHWYLSYELHLRKNRSPFKEIRTILKLGKLVR